MHFHSKEQKGHETLCSQSETTMKWSGYGHVGLFCFTSQNLYMESKHACTDAYIEIGSDKFQKETFVFTCKYTDFHL